MNIYVIYKQLIDGSGQIEKIELVECDADETKAASFSKLYNLQIPTDLRNRISYAYIGTHVI